MIAVHTVLAQSSPAQSFVRPLSSFLYGRSGFHINSASISGGYLSRGFPGATVGLVGSASDALIGGAASMGWSRTGERSSLSLTYDPGYMTYVRNRFSTTSHVLSFSADRQISSKWSVTAGAGAAYSNIDQLIFSPTALQRAATLPANIDEFANVLLRTPFTNETLGSMLTGASVADSPVRGALFGSKILSSIASLSASYSRSERTTLTLSGGFTRAQPVESGQDDQPRSLLGVSNMGNISATLSHSLTPRNTIGASLRTDRVVSGVEDIYRTSASVFIGRKMGMRWFAQAQGGGGTIRSNRRLYELPTGAQYLVGGSIGYMNQAHTIFVASNRSFGDQYGLGAGSTIVTSASWIWAHPRRSWTVLASASDQWFQAREGNIHGWQALAGISKMLSSHLSCRIEYAYIAYDGRSAFSRELSQNAVRASLEWSPRNLRSRR